MDKPRISIRGIQADLCSYCGKLTKVLETDLDIDLYRCLNCDDTVITELNGGALQLRHYRTPGGLTGAGHSEGS